MNVSERGHDLFHDHGSVRDDDVPLHVCDRGNESKLHGCDHDYDWSSRVHHEACKY